MGGAAAGHSLIIINKTVGIYLLLLLYLYTGHLYWHFIPVQGEILTKGAVN